MSEQRILRMTVAFWASLIFVASEAMLMAGESVVSDRKGTKMRLANDRISVVLDEADGVWDVEDSSERGPAEVGLDE